ncbi:MAG: hypothetical protein CVT49_14695 [candidate division Zixibacteria bacterium HGW-Zixibacteria-1]|nr:MAG: hypothetical protein CVT49_14695 [candidate division Zixibacteria bacterium HGW-Zixibacteria-1]
MITYYNTFKQRRLDFNKSIESEGNSVLEMHEDFIILQFDIREALVQFNNADSDLIDAILFILDMQIEDNASVSILCRDGFFSSSTSLLRRIELSVAKIVYFFDFPERIRNYRNGTKYPDKEILQNLYNSEIYKDKEAYAEMCKSTHLNYEWAFYAKYCNILSPIDVTAKLLIESLLMTSCLYIILTARKFVIEHNQNNIKLNDIILDQINVCGNRYGGLLKDFKTRLDALDFSR